MRKILFLMTHLGSGCELYNALNAHSRIDGFRTSMSYDHPEKLWELTRHPHKCDNTAAIYMDELVYNHNLTFKPLCKYCKFVFYIREPKAAISSILETGHYSDATARRYYRYRLRGLYEYSRRVPSAVFLTCDDLRKSELRNLSEYLGVKEPVVLRKAPEEHEYVGGLDDVQDCYEKYLYQIRQG